MLEHAAKKFISCGAKDTVASKLKYQWLCVTVLSVEIQYQTPLEKHLIQD